MSQSFICSTSTAHCTVGSNLLEFGPNAEHFEINDDLKEDAEVWIGGDLSIDGTPALDVDILGMLKGQIIINQNNIGGTWDEDTEIDIWSTYTLSPKPYYAQTALQIGGGSVGVAPFGLHKESCNPDYLRAEDDFPRATVEDLINDEEVHLRFYGPVE